MEEKVKKYEHFVNDILRKDLRSVLDEQDKIHEQLSEYLQLKTVVERLQEGESDSELKTKVDLGCNFYVQASVPDTSRIFVQVGFGFFVEFTLPEALKFIDKKVNQLNERSETLNTDAIKIKANIKLVLEGLREIQELDTKEIIPQRDI